MKDERKELTIDILLEELNNWEPKYPMELIHIGQRQMAMILDYITTLQEENKRLRSYMKRAEDRLIEIENKYGYILDDVVYLLMRGSDKE